MDRLDQAQNKVKTNINLLKERFRSKNELYRFLTLECEAFLPKKESTNVYFLKDIMMGKKEVSPHRHC
jgi:hypothetical protein